MISHPYGLQFAITSSKPPNIGTVLMSIDTESGVAVNTSLDVLGNLSVGGVFDCPTIYTKDDTDAKFQRRYQILANNRWVHLGSLYTMQKGRSCQIEICTTNGYNADPSQHTNATLQIDIEWR